MEEITTIILLVILLNLRVSINVINKTPNEKITDLINFIIFILAPTQKDYSFRNIGAISFFIF